MKHMIKAILMVFLITVFAVGLFSINAKAESDYIRNLSDKKQASLEDGVILVSMLAGNKSINFAAARAYLILKKVIAKNIKGSERLTMGSLATMIMKTKKMGGGLFFSILGGGRYAYRELVFRRFMRPGRCAAHSVSGGELLAIITRVSGEMKIKQKF